MGVRELLAEIKEDTNKYYKERDPLFVEQFFMGYCAANCDLSDDRLDRNFYSYFETWMPNWIEENIAPPDYIKEGPFFQGHRKILPKNKEEFAYFLELCDLCIQDYDNGGSVLHFPWSRKRSKKEYHDRIRVALLHEIPSIP